ncbi:DUF2130 domain-containing protein [Nitrosopumilus sp. K4]|uniref:DUF2130 domain-containing protein n=1 Tax=Nitrosopumilus sp. K4 TaxID=2795383 RepID=UPI001BA90744|nr:DUF2130 domain-containing protein [Nitrosopumilus sp. K4]QUC64388.1 DUF2130 domain-containing protein [Nitrosopumilus sp. K4]
MSNNLSEISEFKCPLCSKTLANTEYELAISQLEEKLQQNFDEKNSNQKEEFEEQISRLKKDYEKTIEENHRSHQIQLEQMQQDIEKSYKTQTELMQKNYDSILKQNEKQFVELEKQLKAVHKKEISEKGKEISQLKKEQEKFKKAAIDQANATYAQKERELYQTIQERDVQISRFAGEIESLKKQLQQSQSELKGEAGELDLYSSLTDAFPNDLFRRQKRGQSSGDVIQQIRIRGKSLDTPIVYDNKAANTVTKKDIEKAKKYQKIHGTNYVIIVSANLPKTSVPNGLFGTREGILLVHPSIVTEVAKQIRTGIIDVSKLSMGKEDQKSKQAKLYQFVMSSEFSMTIEDIAGINEKLYLLQTKEEKDHNTLWKTRRDLYDQLVKTYNDVTSGIESITQTDLDEITAEVLEK